MCVKPRMWAPSKGMILKPEVKVQPEIGMYCTVTKTTILQWAF